MREVSAIRMPIEIRVVLVDKSDPELDFQTDIIVSDNGRAKTDKSLV